MSILGKETLDDVQVENEEGKENEVTEVKFMCKYLVKMIDYGRSYTSEEFTQSILKEYNNLDIEEDKRNFENYANYCGLLPLIKP